MRDGIEAPVQLEHGHRLRVYYAEVHAQNLVQSLAVVQVRESLSQTLKKNFFELKYACVEWKQNKNIFRSYQKTGY